ncbi:MAG: STAS domain-containing protein [Phycisphaerae bacterium]
MSVEQWSESVVLADLADDPQFSEDMSAVIEQCTGNTNLDVVANFANINYLNSSNIARLLKLRKLVTITNQHRLILCGINRHVWGVFLVTGLDRIFEFVSDVSTGLAAMQIKKK